MCVFVREIIYVYVCAEAHLIQLISNTFTLLFHTSSPSTRLTTIILGSGASFSASSPQGACPPWSSPQDHPRPYVWSQPSSAPPLQCVCCWRCAEEGGTLHSLPSALRPIIHLSFYIMHCLYYFVVKWLISNFNTPSSRTYPPSFGTSCLLLFCSFSGPKGSPQHIFQALQYLRNVCNHPALVLKQEHPLYVQITTELQQQGSCANRDCVWTVLSSMASRWLQSLSFFRFLISFPLISCTIFLLCFRWLILSFLLWPAFPNQGTDIHAIAHSTKLLALHQLFSDCGLAGGSKYEVFGNQFISIWRLVFVHHREP